jgi:light-regulated signal transduction histidine kinase (bacteriophytochrome)
MMDEEIQRANARLAAANQELEAFCYSVSHDLRAPLRHIDGFSKLLLERYRKELPDQGRHYLDQVCASTRYMGALIDDLLNLSRVGRQEVKWQVTGFNSLVTEVLRDLRPQTEKRRIEWKIGNLPFIECDPALMKIVFANLLSNAVKYTRPRNPATIEITAATENGHPVVSIRDNGVGFSMKYANKLFGVFQRLHRQEDFEGTGIGLATVQRIIQKHGGRVWAEGELNQGAVFRFTLGSAADHDSYI